MQESTVQAPQHNIDMDQETREYKKQELLQRPASSTFSPSSSEPKALTNRAKILTLISLFPVGTVEPRDWHPIKGLCTLYIQGFSGILLTASILLPLLVAMGHSSKWLCWLGPSEDSHWASDQYWLTGTHMHTAWFPGTQCVWPLEAPTDASHLRHQPSHSQTTMI